MPKIHAFITALDAPHPDELRQRVDCRANGLMPSPSFSTILMHFDQAMAAVNQSK